VYTDFTDYRATHALTASRENGSDGLDRLQHCLRKAMMSLETIQVHRHRGEVGLYATREHHQSGAQTRPGRLAVPVV
jgi:hypothetical protein